MIFDKTLSENKISAVRLRGVEHFLPEQVFDCGQSFRFDRVSGSRHESEYAGVAHGKYISVASDGDELYIYNTNETEYREIWERYLSLDVDYSKIDRDILSRSDTPALRDAVSLAQGIRILKQDPWEALCSFIISQNNNIPRIKKIINSLSLACGHMCLPDGMHGHVADTHGEQSGALYSFPKPQSLIELGHDGLRELGTGFRARYILDASSRVASGQTDLSAIQSMNTGDATDELCRICGVGPKVASCALLFGQSHLDAFPIDVWIKRVIEKYFGDGFSPDMLGCYAGVAQQYLFYYERYLQSKSENEHTDAKEENAS